ncbi:hypothetical protein R5R35_008272 [Gryllus longicercus]|uniref:C2H2-type domain-containing protein n=2 Tax=Gryllus longicercus TaxID=2509291 RepID=A0AAN9W0V5_9ORTH
MICNLPLLFADGYPTCLEKITTDQLEKFVPFMIRCSSGSDISQELTTPAWWPSDLEFSIPLVKPQVVEAKWLTILKSLVCRCYAYHGCEFMLQFCTNLCQCPPQNLSFTTFWADTTSIYNNTTGMLLVTFRNENMCYDRRKECPIQKLLPNGNDNGDGGDDDLDGNVEDDDNDGESVSSQIVAFDIYLCDECDGEFNSLEEVQDHEKICHGQQPDPIPCPIGTADLNSEQANFLDYFHLVSNRSENLPVIEEKVDPPRYKRFLGNSLRYSSIPLSSPLGVLVNKKSRGFNFGSGVHLDRVERYCSTKPPENNARVREPRSSTWPITWKPRKKGEDEPHDDWIHVFKHPKRQWQRRAPYMQDEASLKAVELMKQCQQVELRLQKLTDDEIKYYTTPCASRITTNNTKKSSSKSTLYEEPTVGREGIIESQVSDNNFTSTSMKMEPDYFEDMYSDSEYLGKEGTSVIESVTMPFEKQLPPNTLYVYDKTAPTIERSQLENVTCENSCAPVVDLISNDEELHVFSQRQVGEHFITLPQYYNGRLSDCEAFLSDGTELDIEECGSSTNMTYENEVSNYCSDYGRDLPELIKFITSSAYQQGVEADMFMTIDDRDNPTLHSEKSFARPVSDKSVQCTYDDFDQADYEFDNDDDGDDCCLVKEETCSQSKLPKLFKNRREL